MEEYSIFTPTNPLFCLFKSMTSVYFTAGRDGKFQRVLDFWRSLGWCFGWRPLHPRLERPDPILRRKHHQRKADSKSSQRFKSAGNKSLAESSGQDLHRSHPKVRIREVQTGQKGPWGSLQHQGLCHEGDEKWTEWGNSLGQSGSDWRRETDVIPGCMLQGPDSEGRPQRQVWPPKFYPMFFSVFNTTTHTKILA